MFNNFANKVFNGILRQWLREDSSLNIIIKPSDAFVVRAKRSVEFENPIQSLRKITAQRVCIFLKHPSQNAGLAIRKNKVPNSRGCR